LGNIVQGMGKFVYFLGKFVKSIAVQHKIEGIAFCDAQILGSDESYINSSMNEVVASSNKKGEQLFTVARLRFHIFATNKNTSSVD